MYWQAAIYAADGTLLATHELGIEDETTVVKGGGDISSVSQKQGAVGGQMWDIITVSDDTDGDDAGNIPDGSTVQVSVYKHEGQNQETKGQLVETKTFPVGHREARRTPRLLQLPSPHGRHLSGGWHLLLGGTPDRA